MIINIAGTNGSGKSTVIKGLLENYVTTRTARVREGRARAEGYLLKVKGCAKPVHLIGAYDEDIDTGGCDTITNVRDVFDIIRARLAEGGHVLYEGAIVMNMTRGPELVREFPRQVHILELTTPLADCLAGVNARRASKGEPPLADPKNVASNHGRAHTYANRMKQAGATVHRVSRAAALPKLVELLQQ